MGPRVHFAQSNGYISQHVYPVRQRLLFLSHRTILLLLLLRRAINELVGTFPKNVRAVAEEEGSDKGCSLLICTFLCRFLPWNGAEVLACFGGRNTAKWKGKTKCAHQATLSECEKRGKTTAAAHVAQKLHGKN